PACWVWPARMRNPCCEVQRLIHVEIVVARGGVSADGKIHAGGEHADGIGDATAQPQIAGRIMRHRAAMRADTAHVVIVQPNAMGGDEARTEQAELLDMRSQRAAVASRAY